MDYEQHIQGVEAVLEKLKTIGYAGPRVEGLRRCLAELQAHDGAAATTEYRRLLRSAPSLGAALGDLPVERLVSEERTGSVTELIGLMFDLDNLMKGLEGGNGHGSS